jgi:hypothetical protein
MSPCRSLFDFDLWYHLISSPLNNSISRAFKQCLTSILCGDNIVLSAFLSNCSNLLMISFFSFLYALFIFFAHPLIYLHNVLILFYHISIEVEPFVSRCHTSVTFSWKPSLNNHASSNLKVHVFGCDGNLVSNNSEVWSEIPLGSVRTITFGNLSSHSVLTRILSSFS